MPHVLASSQGVKNAVWTQVEHKGEDGKAVETKVFEKFEPGVVGSLTPKQYDAFVRDTVNFLDYVGEPTQVERQRARHLGRVVPAHVHGHRVHAEEGILERRPLSAPDVARRLDARRAVVRGERICRADVHR